jgi:hypothetical protein
MTKFQDKNDNLSSLRKSCAKMPCCASEFILTFLYAASDIQNASDQFVCYIHLSFVNLLKPTGHVMHHQFNIQQLYALPTLYLCVSYLSENKQRLVPLTA